VVLVVLVISAFVLALPLFFAVLEQQELTVVAVLEQLEAMARAVGMKVAVLVVEVEVELARVVVLGVSAVFHALRVLDGLCVPSFPAQACLSQLAATL